MQDVLQHAWETPQRRVHWLHPTWPVLARFWSSNTSALDSTDRVELQYPATPFQLRDTIKQMGLLAGIMDRIYMHATRKGAARDFAHLPAGALSGSGLTNDETRQLMHHTHTAMRSGVTDSYIGGLSANVFNIRAQHAGVHKREPNFTQPAPSWTLPFDIGTVVL